MTTAHVVTTRTCPTCGQEVTNWTSQWNVHLRTHRAGRRRWTTAVPYWEWEWSLIDPGDGGEAVRLTRTAWARRTPSVYSVHIDDPDGGDPVTVRLEATTTPEAKTEAQAVYRRLREEAENRV